VRVKSSSSTSITRMDCWAKFMCEAYQGENLQFL
jgi:hypothetical protein